jgi:hypothetical protein
MKKFKSFIKEEIVQSANVKSGSVDISDSAVRDNINGIIASATRCRFVTPYVALERIRRTLASYHIFLPGHSFLEGDSGTAMFPVNQFGVKIGQTEDGQVVTTPPSDFTVYFEYNMSDNGMFDVFCEILDQDELKDVLSDLEDELNEEHEGHHVHPFMPETGPRHTPGSNQPVIATGFDTPDMLKGENRDKMKAHLERGDEPKDGSSDKDENVHSGLRFAGAETGPKITPGSNQPMAIAAKVIKKLNELNLSPEQQMDDKQSKLNELSAELVGKVNKKRLEKPSKTAAAHATLTRAVRKKWLESEVGKLKEEEQLDEISLKTKIKAYAATRDVDADYNYGDKVHDQGDRIKASIEKKHGKKAGEHAERAAYGKPSTPATRSAEKAKSDPLTNVLSKTNKMRVTKSGVANKQDQKTNASVIKSRLGKHGKSNLPEGRVLPDLSKSESKGEHSKDYLARVQKQKDKASEKKTAASEYLKMKGSLKEENIQELSKKTLGSYIKKASHDVATKSAATGRYAERANKEEDNRKKNQDYSGYQQGRKDSAFADKMFKKSWKRREGIAKATDKLTKEEVIQELSNKLKARYTKKAEFDKKSAERQAELSDREAADTGRSKESRKSFKDESKWLKGIAAKRAKGIEMAKKKS